ncbi:MAG: PepSY domain-containing protein, partial [Acinetobacter sp.]
QIYENRGQFLQEQRKALIQENSENQTPGKGSKNQETAGNGQRQSRGENREASQRGEMTTNRQTRGEGGENREKAENIERQGHGEGRSRRSESHSAPLTDLTPILTQANKEWKNNPVSSISIVSPNTDQAKIELRALHAVSVAHRNVYETLNFDGVSGKNITDESTKLLNPSISNGIYNVLTVLHEARGVDLALRWLLFLSGIVGTLMIVTGLVLWCVKRAPQQQKQGYKSFGYRVVEVTNIAAIIGLPIACAAYFYANRFIPADMEMRLNWEIRTFFMVWLISLLHAMLRNHKQAWMEQLVFATLAFALLPVLNFMTGGQAIWNTIHHGQWMIASFDLMAWLLAILFFYAYKKVKNHKGLPVKKVRTTTAQESEQ